MKEEKKYRRTREKCDAFVDNEQWLDWRKRLIWLMLGDVQP